MSDGLDIVAVGARTPVGLTVQSTAAAIRAGISGYTEIPFAGPTGEPQVAAIDGLLDRRLEGSERLVMLVQSVLDEVFSELEQTGSRPSGYHVLLAMPEARPGFSERDAAWVMGAVRNAVRSKGVEAKVELAGRGHAGGIAAVEKATSESATSIDDLFLVVGVDSYYHGESLLWLERERRIAQPEIRGGFFPGEGAGCIALARPALRRRLQLPRYAVVRRVRTARENLLRDSETGSFGVGMSAAVEGALGGLELPREAVDVAYTDINGERYRSEEWGFVALRTHQSWKSIVYEAPSDCWGDVGAAFGPLAAGLVTQSFARHYAPGPRALVMAGSDNGLRGAMLIESPSIVH